MPKRSVMTTRRYRGRGEDIWVGAMINIAAGLIIQLAHEAHKFFGHLPRHYLSDYADPCVPAGIAASVIGVLYYSVTRNSEAMSDLPPADVEGPAPRRDKSLWYAHGVAFTVVMLLEALAWAWYAHVKSGRADDPWINHLRITLFVGFWTAAFTYLPVLGLVRSGGPRAYWHRHRHLFVFPAAVIVHGAVFRIGLAYVFDALFARARMAPVSPADDLRLTGLSAILGFFSAVPFHRLYERLLFGRNLTMDPATARKQAASRLAREAENGAKED
ncbi:MAG TPA: hypothetical protein VL588_06825 [Bdellovibrionota bacterium]|nr:hypothetical protein [Bdellovibrionota bacterium]